MMMMVQPRFTLWSALLLLVPTAALAQDGSPGDGPTAPDDVVVQRSVSLRVGDIGCLDIAPGTESQLDWSGYDPGMIAVEYGGHFVALGEGHTSIVPVLNGDVSRAIRVEVLPSPVVALTLNGVPYDLNVGDSAALRAVAYRLDWTIGDVTPAAIWRSSDPAVVDVDVDGRIFAVGVGSARVEAWVDGQVATTGRLTVYAAPLFGVMTSG